jgi:hypothetical protein
MSTENTSQEEPNKKSVAEIVKETIDMMNDPSYDDPSLRKYYNTRPEGNRLRYYGD